MLAWLEPPVASDAMAPETRVGDDFDDGTGPGLEGENQCRRKGGSARSQKQPSSEPPPTAPCASTSLGSMASTARYTDSALCDRCKPRQLFPTAIALSGFAASQRLAPIAQQLFVVTMFFKRSLEPRWCSQAIVLNR